MQRHLEQHYSIKICAKRNKTAAETFGIIQEAYKEEAMSHAIVFMWHKRFKDGREDVEDDDRAGRPSTSRTDENVVKVRELLNTDRRFSVRLLADELGKMRAKLIQKVLTNEQKTRRLAVCDEMLAHLQNDPNFLDKVVTGDETYEYDPETKWQSAEWHTTSFLKPNKACMSKSREKSMLIVFFDTKGVFHKEFIPSGQTVTGQFYSGILRRLMDRVRRVLPEIKDDWVIPRGNAPSNT